jgi:hypothetical protein
LRPEIAEIPPNREYVPKNAIAITKTSTRRATRSRTEYTLQITPKTTGNTTKNIEKSSIFILFDPVEGYVWRLFVRLQPDVFRQKTCERQSVGLEGDEIARFGRVEAELFLRKAELAKLAALRACQRS